MPRIRPVKNLRDYFEKSVADSIRRNDVRVDDLTSSYVVDLLTLPINDLADRWRVS